MQCKYKGGGQEKHDGACLDMPERFIWILPYTESDPLVHEGQYCLLGLAMGLLGFRQRPLPFDPSN